MIRLDVSQSSNHCSVVVVCSTCGYWRAFALNRTEGWAAGARHQATVHPGIGQAQNALDQQRFRNARS